MPKVLISDSMNNAAENILKSNNIEVDVLTNLNNSQLIDKISDYEGLIVRSTTQVTKDILDAIHLSQNWLLNHVSPNTGLLEDIYLF